MTYKLTLLVCFLSISASLFAEDNEHVVKLKCVPFKSLFTSGNAIDIAIQIENKSDVEVTFQNSGLGPDFGIKVRYADGNPTSITDHFRNVKEFGGAGKMEYFVLKPNESLIMVLSLSRYFDFTRAGTYDVAITRDDVEGPKGKVLKLKSSITLEVEVESVKAGSDKYQEASNIIKKLKENATTNK